MQCTNVHISFTLFDAIGVRHGGIAFVKSPVSGFAAWKRCRGAESASFVSIAVGFLRSSLF